jgi:hypothetical protein
MSGKDEYEATPKTLRMAGRTCKQLTGICLCPFCVAKKISPQKYFSGRRECGHPGVAQFVKCGGEYLYHMEMSTAGARGTQSKMASKSQQQLDRLNKHQLELRHTQEMRPNEQVAGPVEHTKLESATQSVREKSWSRYLPDTVRPPKCQVSAYWSRLQKSTRGSIFLASNFNATNAYGLFVDTAKRLSCIPA